LNALSANLQKFVAAVAVPTPALLVALTPGDQCANVSATAVAWAAQMVADAQFAVADIGSLVNDDTLVYNLVTKPENRSCASNSRPKI
jgi:hypothetical protein